MSANASLPLTWAGDLPYPPESELLPPEGIRCRVVQDGHLDVLPFLMDVSIATYKDKLYLAWYNSTDAEICGTSLIRGICSSNGGENWMEPFTIAGSFEALGKHYVPINFFPTSEALYALITTMEGKNITTALDLYRKSEACDDQWEKISTVSDGFITNSPPLKLPNGNWIVGGWTPMKSESPAYPVVLISDGDNITQRWRYRFLYDPLRPNGIRIRCPEITLQAQGECLTAYIRSGNHEGPPYLFTSEDCGETWSEPIPATMPIAGSKIFAGKLSNGKRYLLYNMERGYFVRTLLVIAVAEPDGPFDRVYSLLEGKEARLGGREGNWYYPAACEHNGYLLVACTLQEPDDVRSAILVKIPLDSL